MNILPFPEQFLNKGRYRKFTSSWSPTNEFSDEPTYPGQMPLTYPEDASPLEAFLGGYVS